MSTIWPNIIFIIADELEIGELGTYGKEMIKAPKIDKMKNKGIKFTQVYT